MIDILFQSCCKICPHINVTWEQTKGFGEVVTVIGCAHSCVCGDYLAQQQELTAEDTTVKGFYHADG